MIEDVYEGVCRHVVLKGIKLSMSRLIWKLRDRGVPTGGIIVPLNCLPAQVPAVPRFHMARTPAM